MAKNFLSERDGKEKKHNSRGKKEDSFGPHQSHLNELWFYVGGRHLMFSPGAGEGGFYRGDHKKGYQSMIC